MKIKLIKQQSNQIKINKNKNAKMQNKIKNKKLI